MKKIAAILAAIFALVLVGSGIWPFPDFGTTDSGMSESITIGSPTTEYAALVYIADDQGYFSRNGLNVTIRNFSNVLTAVNGMENNESDISVSSEYSIVTETFKKEKISVIGSIDKHQSTYLIGRKDRGIENVSDLKGKKIGITRGAQSEFFLGRLLNLNGLSLQEVTIVNVLPTQYANAIANGSIDALMASYRNLDQSKKQLGSNIVVLPAQSNQPSYVVIAGRNDWIARHPEQINRLLKSLDQAEEYTIDHPDTAKAIIQKRLNITDADIAIIWPTNQFSLTLDQSLLIAMNDEGHWMINNNLTSERTLPDLRDFIYTKGLEEVKPESVNIR